MTRAGTPGIRALVQAIERGNADALEQLARAEFDAFTRGDAVAGDLGYARWCLAGGDLAGALETLRSLHERSQR